MLIDLHTHTTGSDGSYTPKELIEAALDKNIEVLSITDHDTLDGVKSLIQKLSSVDYDLGLSHKVIICSLTSDPDRSTTSNVCMISDTGSRISDSNELTENGSRIMSSKPSMDEVRRQASVGRWTMDETKIFSNILVFVPGVEISAEFPKTLHILGYGIDINNEKLNSTLKELQDYRLNRNKRMVENLNNLGFKITLEELKKKAGGNLIGRPHFAQLMLEKGYVDSYQEAFDRYLKKGAPLYMNKKRLDPDKAIELILNAGGFPVLAHPYQTQLNDEDLHSLVKKLVSYGLRGIEVFYSQHTEEMTKKYLEFANEFNLFITAGSDFHGDNKPEIELGMQVPYTFLQKFLCEI
ncbi:MAG: PHP domain-containing protein [Thermotogota bacterium]|nr:PHP domain-containing protein [Thermotogota bacterium]